MVDFLSTLDILARIGGLWAAFKIILAIFLPFMILIFMFSLGDIIIRKAQQKLRIMQLKELQKNFGKIKESIKKQMIQFRGDQNKVNQMEADLQIITEDSPEMKTLFRIIKQAKRDMTTKRNFDKGGLLGIVKNVTRIVSYRKT